MSIFHLMARVACALVVFANICRAQTLVPLSELESTSLPNARVTLAPKGNLLAHTLREDRGALQVKLRRVPTSGAPLHILEENKATRAVVFTPSGDALAWVFDDEIGVLSDLHQDEIRGLKPTIRFFTSVVAFSPDGTTLAAASDAVKNGQVLVRLFDAKTGAVRGDLKAVPLSFYSGDAPTPLSALAFSADGKQVVAANLASTCIWNVETSQLLSQKFHLQAEQIALSSDGTSAGIIFSEPVGPSDGSELHSRQLWLESPGKSFDLTLKPGLGGHLEISGTPTFSIDGRFIAASVWRGGQNAISIGVTQMNFRPKNMEAGLAPSSNRVPEDWKRAQAPPHPNFHLRKSYSIWRTSDGKEILRRPTQHEQRNLAFGPTNGNQTTFASVYTNPIDKLQHAVLWQLTIPDGI